MNVGAAQVDITPPPGIDLSGFAARAQPSVGVLDPLYARALLLEQDGRRLLWVHFDLIAVERAFVDAFRAWATEQFGLAIDEVLLSATHTHAAPTTVPIVGCGRRDEAYDAALTAAAQRAAREAIRAAAPADLLVGDAPLELAVHRRGPLARHTDPHAHALVFRRPDGSVAAACLNYAMHPVALGYVNRQVSGDWCAYAARSAATSLGGSPVVLVTNGAAGNLNPPAENMPVEQVRALGERVAAAALSNLAPAPSTPFAVRSVTVPVPLDRWRPEHIDRVIAAHSPPATADPNWRRAWSEATTQWREHRLAELVAGSPTHVDVELHVVRLGDTYIVAVNGEIFSKFTGELRRRSGRRLFVVGYANAAFGYIPSAEAYDEPGYEVDTAHFFYDTFRPQRGGLELLCDRAVEVVEMLTDTAK
jgi:hypothetical protein